MHKRKIDRTKKCRNEEIHYEKMRDENFWTKKCLTKFARRKSVLTRAPIYQPYYGIVLTLTRKIGDFRWFGVIIPVYLGYSAMVCICLHLFAVVCGIYTCP